MPTRRLPAVLLLSIAPAAAHAAPLPGFYVGAFLGAQLPEDAETDAEGFASDLDYDTGLGGGFSAGYDFGYLRLEGELSARGFDSDAIDFGGARIEDDAEFDTEAFMANLFFDFPVPGLSDRLGLYGGVGVGIARVAVDTAAGDDDDWVAAGQAMAGVSVELTRNLTFLVGYRGFTTADASLESGDAEFDLDNGITHAGEIGLRFTF
ncbi:opacity protein-like surface antigen [Phycisphaera mikurensis]|nr:opacity protein-like surface antigen [Phycisphaera mikurensis]